MARHRFLVSIVVSVLNEPECLNKLYQELDHWCFRLEYDFEFVIVDDGSTDSTAQVLQELRSRDPRVRYLLLSRNFGHQPALSAELAKAAGDAVIMMDGDLQHPPKVIAQLLEQWKSGFEVVHTERENTADAGIVKRVFSTALYRFFNFLSVTTIQAGGADFRLMSRRALDQLNALPERERFLRGLIFWLGFRQTCVCYVAANRWAGRPSYSFMRNIRFALDGVTSFSFFHCGESLSWAGASLY